MRIRRASVAGTLALTALLVLGGATPAMAAATPADLGVLPGTGSSHATAINDHGVIVGESRNSDYRRAVRWAPDGSMTELARPEGRKSTQAWAINSSGVVVGDTQDPELERPVRWDAQGRVEVLTLPADEQGNSSGYAVGVNDDGVVVGHSFYYTEDRWFERGLRWSPDGAMSILDPLPGHERSLARAVGADGTAVGSSSVGNTQVAVRWLPDGTVTPLPALPGQTSSRAEAVNRHGVIVGLSGSRPVRWNLDGTVTDLGLVPGGRAGIANDINDDGLITIESRFHELGDSRPVLRELDGTLTVLPVLHGEEAGLTSGVNNSGTVVGLSGDPRTFSRATRWDR
ncbi:DUF3466 family protein [Crossiella sp. SN42]|uniref:DUF3466 family protein n=1 Tax=Crossiella sp. SN42 TaxID=2944808 RepID=UPI00207D4B7D|nr:DUF3466 family protein [Crossiella sp. SN42]MCO1580365.1 DUF3466 family protein [Crossiella sp. SN42]